MQTDQLKGGICRERERRSLAESFLLKENNKLIRMPVNRESTSYSSWL